MKSVRFGAAENLVLSHRLGSRKDDVSFRWERLTLFAEGGKADGKSFERPGTQRRRDTSICFSKEKYTPLPFLICQPWQQHQNCQRSCGVKITNIIFQYLLKTSTLCIAQLKTHLGIFIPLWLECLRLRPSRRPYAMAPMPAGAYAQAPAVPNGPPACCPSLLACCLLPTQSLPTRPLSIANNEKTILHWAIA